MCHILLREAEALVEGQPEGAVHDTGARNAGGGQSEWAVYAARAREHTKAKSWDAALADFTKAIALNDGNAKLRQDSGNLHARRGEWDKAAQDFAAAVDVNPTQADCWQRLAALRVHLGDREGYRAACKKALRRFSGTQNPFAAASIIRMCTLVPGAVDDMETVSRLADFSLAADERSPWIVFRTWNKAMVEYRLGRFASAIDVLKGVDNQGRDAPPHLAGKIGLVRAMAHCCLGEADKARHWLEEARQTMRQEMPAGFPKIEEGAAILHWPDWLMAHILLREAEATLEQAGAPPAEQKGDSETPGKQE
jgi:tetratricopeptide (TPR) repeat protein